MCVVGRRVTPTFLLDANVLIALTVEEHEHHRRAAVWLATVESVALCPVIEGALVRFLVRLGERPEVALAVLRAVHALPKCSFWPDSRSYVDTDLEHVRGHRQVTDAYLVAAARHRDGVVATLDEGLAQHSPQGALLIPRLPEDALP